MSTLYEEDLAAWAEAQAAALRAAARVKLNTPLELDWANLAEEIEQLARSQRRELRSRLFRLLTHLLKFLKWCYRPTKRTRSWRLTIDDQRREIGGLLDDSPSLRSLLPRAFPEAYRQARGRAALETGLAIASFPETCPFRIEAVLDPGWWPEARG